MNDNGQPIHPDNELIAVGRIRKPFGLRGQCYIDAFGQTVASFKVPVTVMLGMDTVNVVPEVLSFIKSTPKGYLCGFAGYDSVEKADALRSRYIFVNRNRIPTLSAHQYFTFELEGMNVISVPGNEPVGIVKNVEIFPTVDALNVVRPDATTVYVSINNTIIEKIDRETRCITVYKTAIEQLLER